ncbi:efflux RND transporter periplasmic adaptor subunit [Amantichitinum ursilacus]|uniref:Multidrug efflux pump subunit AcrA n=1 Tax=Amantichitinum ursilacus TaxID=857265 RepID=A0A0N0GNH8_9NEIS|nr:efflux RND transporter periplasmic adaptor subunit [Amantichitinum ursilacus]KPC52782.1 Multidrug efflux pump subunit AcrA precursor [Amantichitinum ursilacus]
MRDNKTPFRLRLATVAALAAIATLSACGEKPAQQAPSGPPEVNTVQVSQGNLPLTTELQGRVNAVRVAEVRARAAGIVLKRTFEEGSDVKAGQVLFRIDPAPLQATLDSAKAAQANAEAALAQAKLVEGRYRDLVTVNAVSKQDYDNALIAVKQGEAQVASAKAQVTSANLNLGYTTVTSPISGTVGKAQVTEGALVGQGEATLLATVTQTDPIYVDVTQSSTELLKLRRALQSGKVKGAQGSTAEVSLILEDGSVYSQKGKLLFSDITVDQTSGMVTLRAEFPNPHHDLLPGMYVRAKVAQAVQDNAITVPQMAVQRGPTGNASVMVVGADGKVEARPITTGAAVGNVWVVSSGLKAGEQVIVAGLQKVKPGAQVKAVPAADASAPAAAPASAAASANAAAN